MWILARVRPCERRRACLREIQGGRLQPHMEANASNFKTP